MSSGRDRPLPKDPTQQPKNVRKINPSARREVSQHPPSAIALQAFQVSPPATPEASLQTSISASGPSHYLAFGDGVSNPANGKEHLVINSVGPLTSLLLQRQDLEAQLCTLESIMREHSPLCISPLHERATSCEPFSERLAGILPSSMYSLRDNNYSTLPSYSMPLAESIDDVPLGVNHAKRPAPLNTRSSQMGGYCALQSPHTKKTCKVIKDCHQDTMLKLAAVDLEIELTYLSADRRFARSA